MPICTSAKSPVLRKAMHLTRLLSPLDSARLNTTIILLLMPCALTICGLLPVARKAVPKWVCKKRVRPMQRSRQISRPLIIPLNRRQGQASRNTKFCRPPLICKRHFQLILKWFLYQASGILSVLHDAQINGIQSRHHQYACKYLLYFESGMQDACNHSGNCPLPKEAIKLASQATYHST